VIECVSNSPPNTPNKTIIVRIELEKVPTTKEMAANIEAEIPTGRHPNLFIRALPTGAGQRYIFS